MSTARSRALVSLSRILVYTHRWLGITLGALFVGWFLSGIVLMYAGMPELTTADRLAHRPPIDTEQLRVAPFEAARHLRTPLRALQLVMFAGRPVYHLSSSDGPVTVFADTNERLVSVSAAQALDEVRRFAPAHAERTDYDTYLTDPDQWTLEIRRQLPMHRMALNDADDTRIYVAATTGEIVLATTATTRRWAYPGAILHWLYLTPFRRHVGLWAQTIIWTSVLGTVMCLAGLVWGLWRFSPRARFRLRRHPQRSPYARWMKWHHYLGLVFGVASLTWIFSGLMSMDPWDWHPGTTPTAAQAEAFAGGSFDMSAVSLDTLVQALERVQHPREAALIQAAGTHWLATDAGVVPLARDDRTLPLDDRSMRTLARTAMPQASVAELVRLDRYDSYYYDRAGSLPLPVYRIRYDDAVATWLYVDPARARVLRKEERLTRLNRWLYHGLHSLDFPFLYYRRPLWDLLVIVLSIGGLALSLTTVMPAWRRLVRHARRMAVR